MNIQLPTGNTIYVSDYDWLFRLKDEDINLFYQSAIADDLGTYIDNPFSGRPVMGKLEIEDISEEDLDNNY